MVFNKWTSCICSIPIVLLLFELIRLQNLNKHIFSSCPLSQYACIKYVNYQSAQQSDGYYFNTQLGNNRGWDHKHRNLIHLQFQPARQFMLEWGHDRTPPALSRLIPLVRPVRSINFNISLLLKWFWQHLTYSKILDVSGTETNNTKSVTYNTSMR